MLSDRERRGTAKDNAPCFAAAASLARLGEDNAEIARLLQELLEDGNWDLNGATDVTALRYAWHHGMPVRRVVRTAVGRLPGSRQNYTNDSASELIRLLGEIGPDARDAIPALTRLQRSRYEIRLAAKAALALIDR